MTDSILLQNEYESLLGRKLNICPIPVYPFPQADVRSHGFAENIPQDKVIISFVGGARYNKGFDIFVELVERLHRDRQLLKKVFFISQIDIHPQTNRDELKVNQAVDRLKGIAANSDDIRLYFGSLGMQDYYSLLSCSHIVILPYRDEAYRSSTANILIEAILLGKVPIVSENTWMCNELEKFNLRDLAFKTQDIENLCATTQKIIRDYPRYAQAISIMRRNWQSFHSAERLTEIVIA